MEENLSNNLQVTVEENLNTETEINNLHEILTVEEIASFLRVNRKTIYDAVKRGDIPCQKIGRVYRFHKKVVLRWLNGQGRVSTERRYP